MVRNQIDFESLERSESITKFDKTTSQILQALKDNADVFSTSLTQQTAVLEQRFEESDLRFQQTGNEIKASIQTMSQNTVVHDHHTAVSAIISSLSFSGMNDRFERVVDAHAHTYSWIFESNSNSNQSWDSFTSWLGQDHGDPVYWVSGKAASGKSTLMHYIIRNDWRLCKFLDAWTQGRPLVISNFFFWSTGTATQKSQNGLFRSLLHQIFSQNPHLVQEALPDLVHLALSLPYQRVKQRVWSLKELKQTFWNLIEQDKKPTCYCLLIDGLDEYDGDYLELSMFLKAIATCSNVKLCVASRPLLAFEHHFDGFPKLRLQDLTAGDISKFVQDRLEEHPRFHALAQREPNESSNLISEIVQTSCGVFLWVSLVVKSLLEGLTNHDGLLDLRKRLRELPPELEGLYSTMLKSISPPFYREQASRLFQLVYQSPMPLSPAELSFADDEDQDLAFKTEIGSLAGSEILHRAEIIVPKLKSRCAGLLEVQVRRSGLQNPESLPSSYVQYLHLTVREYLERPDVWTDLLELTRSSRFDANVSLLRSMLLMIKSRDFVMSGLDVKAVILLTLQAEGSTGKAQTALLDAIDTTASLVAFARNDNNGGHWLSLLLHKEYHIGGTIYGDCDSCNSCPDSLFGFAVRNGLTLFVRDFIRRSAGLKNGYRGRSLLEHASWRALDYKHTHNEISFQVQPSMIAMLFGEGLRPNAKSYGSTPWRALLAILTSEPPLGLLPSPWIDVCKLYILFGADVKAGCEVSGEWKSTWEVLESAFQHLPSESLHELERMVLDRGGGRAWIEHPRPKTGHHQYSNASRNHDLQQYPNSHPRKEFSSHHPHRRRRASFNDDRRARDDGRHAMRHDQWSTRQYGGYMNRRQYSQHANALGPRYHPYRNRLC